MAIARESSTKTITALIDELVSALLGTHIYNTSHPQVQETVDSLQHQLLELTELLGQESLCLTVTEDMLLHHQKPLLSASLSASRLIRALGNLGASGIELNASATKEHLSSLLEALATSDASGQDYRSVNSLLQSQGCQEIKLHDLLSMEPETSGGQSQKATMGPAARVYQSGITILQDQVVNLGLGHRIALDLVRSHVERMYELMQTQDGPLINLANCEQDDSFGLGHSVRVAVLAMNLASQMTEDVETIVRLGNAAMLHDIGKALLPLELVLSRAELEPEQLQELQRHAELGAELLMDNGADPLAITVAFGHHRTLHQGGYPETRHKYQPSTSTEIVKICDVYEALTANRPYRPSMPPPDAYRVMLGMHGHFDKNLLRRFMETIGMFPAGQILQLRSGEIARVLKQSRHIKEPVIEILVDAKGNILPEEERKVIDISAPSMGKAYMVEGIVDLPELAEDPKLSL